MAKLRGKAKKAHTAAKKGRSTAKKSRSSLKDQRKDARKEGKKGKVKSLTRKIMLQSKEMRKQGDIMRDLTKREKGQRTTYTGPSKQKTIRLIKKTTGDVLPGPTDWQNVNTKWLDDIMKANPKYSLSDARLHLKDMFAKDRAGYLKEQQSRYDTKKFATFTPTGKIKNVGLRGKDRGEVKVSGPGDMILETKYKQPTAKDWSRFMPDVSDPTVPEREGKWPMPKPMPMPFDNRIYAPGSPEYIRRQAMSRGPENQLSVAQRRRDPDRPTQLPGKPDPFRGIPLKDPYETLYPPHSLYPYIYPQSGKREAQPPALESQKALVEGGGLYYQPWAQGQGIPENLLNYQQPSGAAVTPSYSNPTPLDGVGGNGGGNGGNGGNGGRPEWGGHTNYQDWYMSTSNPFGHYWALQNAGGPQTHEWKPATGTWDFQGGSAPAGPNPYPGLVDPTWGQDASTPPVAESIWDFNNPAEVAMAGNFRG